jgi:hypothetical protein
MRAIIFASVLLGSLACWYVAIRWPIVFAIAFAVFQDWRDQRRRAKAERVELPEMRWIN